MSTGSPPSDDELLERWRAGDSEAGDQLLVRHFVSLRSFVLGRIGDDELAKEIVQDTMLAVLSQARERFRGESTFKSYLFGIAKNKIREQLRRLTAQRERIDGITQSLADLTGRGSSILADKERVRWLFEALRAVPLETADLLELYYFHDLKVAELAAMWGAKLNTIKSRLRLGRAKLGKAYTALAGDSLDQPLDDEQIEALMQAAREPARRGELREPGPEPGPEPEPDPEPDE